MIYLTIFLLSVFITISLVPLTARLAVWFKALDEPNPRKVHTQPIPRTGGLAMAIGVLISFGFLSPASNMVRAFILGVTLLVLIAFRNSLVAILSVIGFYHISNLLYDFAGLKDLSYLEMVATMGKVLGGIAKPADELQTLAWLLGLIILCAVAATTLFVSRDPSK